MKLRKRTRFWVLAVALGATACAAGGTGPTPAASPRADPSAAASATAATPDFEPARIERDIAWLADDQREGRSVGSEGLAAAARYLADGFRTAGLEPGGDDGTFLRPFDMVVSVEIAAAELRLDGVPLVRGADFDAFLTSSDGQAEGDVVFAGYGISAPEQGYDDYAGVDVEGKVVLVLNDRPSGEASPFAQKRAPELLRRSYKFANAHKHGAAAVLLAPSLEEAEGLAGNAGAESSNPTTQAGGVIALGTSRAAAQRIVAAAGGASLEQRQQAINSTGKPASALLTGARVKLDVRAERKVGTVANVVAVRPGSDPALRGEIVLIGAHYDHLGLGDFGSLAPDRAGQIHNGADDNASGAAGLLALGRAFAAAPPPRRTLVLAAFTGEEAGLVGSAEYVREPPFPITDTVAMINLDMIGRLRNRELIVFGVETSPEFPALVEAAARGSNVEAKLTEGGYSASDQTSFYARDVPVLFFFTGIHSEYHTPDDDAELINPEGTAEVLRVVYNAARALLDEPVRPQVVTAEAPSRGTGGGGGYGPYLGTVPDFAGSGEAGVLLQGVRGNSPAANAGLRAGDRIVGFDGASVANLEEYAALLFSSEPGQRVQIIAVRDGKRLNFEATLGQRR